MVKELLAASFFSGIGGPELAAEWAGFTNAFHCEKADFPRKILNYYWPKSKCYEDITKETFHEWRGRIHRVTGGFPCQPVSVAGKRKGTDDDRYLWPEMLRAVCEIRPPWVVAENVTGILTVEDKTGDAKELFPILEGRSIARMADLDRYEAVYTRQAKMLIGTICNDLEQAGYEVQSFVIPAASVEAPHRRDRVWIVAYCADARVKSVQRKTPIRPGRPINASDSDSIGCEGKQQATAIGKKYIKKRRSVRDIIATNGSKPNVADTDMHGYPSSQIISGNKKRNDGNKAGKETISESSGCSSKANATDARMPRCEKRPVGKGADEKKYIGTDGAGSNGTTADAASQRRDEDNRDGKPRFVDKARAEYNWHNFPTQSPVCSGNDGISGRLDAITFSKWRNESIKAFGNAWVPQVAYQIIEPIARILRGELTE